MGTAHEFTARIRSFAECQRLNQVAKECGQVVVRNGNQANAKSLLSLMSLDYSASVRIVASTSEELFALHTALLALK